MLTTKQITDLSRLDQLTYIFDLYRQFYQQESNLLQAADFLTQRILNLQSVIFVVVDDKNVIAGFTQLYPIFSSVSMQHTWLLNDLYVLPTHRGTGAATALLQRAKLFAKQTNSKGLALETAQSNPAQKLYEKLGWQLDTECRHYFWRTN